MTQHTTTKSVQNLADAVARDGLSPHQDDINHIAELAGQSGLYPGATAVLRDDCAPDVLRSRAFLTITRNWSEIEATSSRWTNFRRAFDAFIAQWNEHQNLRTSDHVEDLWESRIKLDALRADMTLHRTLAC